MGEDLPHPMLFQDPEIVVPKESLGPDLDVIAGVLRDASQKSVQVSDEVPAGVPVLFWLVFLLEDETLETVPEDFPGRPVKPVHEDVGIQVLGVFRKAPVPP